MDRPMSGAVRVAVKEDLPAITRLSAQLGYPVGEDELGERLEALKRHPGQQLLLWEEDDEVVGWAHVSECLGINHPPRAEITAMVVDEKWRSRGVGGKLVNAVEAWAKARGLSQLRVRSQEKRSRAHAFYLNQGFEHVKTS